MLLKNLIKNFFREKGVNFFNKFIYVNWEAGGCIKVSATYLFWRKYDPFDFSSHNNITFLMNSSAWNKSENLKTNSTNPFSFFYRIDSNSSIEVEVIIALQCDQEWGKINKNSVPFALPQSHLVLSRTEEGYFAKNNEYMIKSEKTVYKNLKKIKINVENDLENAKETLEIVAHFKKCNNKGSISDINERNHLKIYSLPSSPGNFLHLQGEIQYFPDSFQAYLWSYGDFVKCDSSHLGENLDLFTNAKNETNYDNIFFKKNDSSQIISKELTINENFNYKDLIGRSILLKDNSNRAPLIAQLNILQNFECEQEAKNCNGINLSNEGVCLIMKDFGNDAADDFLIKLLLSPSMTMMSAKMIINLKAMKELYDDFSKVVIRNEEKETVFLVNKSLSHNLFFSSGKEFHLPAEKALSNKIMISIGNGENMKRVGVCSVSLYGNNDTTLYEETDYGISFKEQNESTFSTMWLAFLIFCIILIVAFYLINKSNKYLFKFIFKQKSIYLFSS